MTQRLPTSTRRTRIHASTLLAGLLLCAPLRAGEGEILFLNGFEGTGNVPQFVPVDDQAAVAERTVALDIDTAEPTNQAGLTFSLDAAPAGMTIATGTGELTWTPSRNQLGLHPVTVRVEDLAGFANTLIFRIEVVDPNAAPSIMPIADSTVAVGALL